MMQVDQRGACDGVSGTSDNVMIDDMVQRDAILHNRNLFTTWIDVRKAFDSVSHSFLVEILKIHRLPEKIVKVVENIICKWNIVLMIPIKERTIESRVIKLRNGELQGDTFCPNLYTLCNNPLSWLIRSFKGYMMSTPIKEKITHTLFIDDLKIYADSVTSALLVLNMIKPRMLDCGLEWNKKKCKGCFLKKGKYTQCEDLLLDDDSKIECLKEGETYKFMGVQQYVKLDKNTLETSLSTTVKQRTHIIWKSSLSDWNKVLATNIFVNSSIEYYFWACTLRIDFLKDVDRSIRKIMNMCGAKHTNTVNEGLYISRQKGGRGLRSLENAYKEIKIKAAMKMKLNTDPRMKLVNQFNQIHLNTKSYSIFKDAKKYCEEKQLNFVCELERLVISFPGEDVSSNDENCMEKLKRGLKMIREVQCLQKIVSCKWQGAIIKSITEDESIMKGNVYWLQDWKSCPTSTISELMQLLYQTLGTKCYQKYRSEDIEMDTVCRLCKTGEESVRHLMSNCRVLLEKVYKDRHDAALKCFFFKMLMKFKMIDTAPPWFSPDKIKPLYQNQNYEVFWDIPEYSGRDDETIKDGARPDGKLIMHRERKIFLIEQTITWIENRNTGYDFKNSKYVEVQTNLRIEYPNYEVHFFFFYKQLPK